MSERLTHGSLFSGIEGFGLGAALAGIKTEWSCEFEDYQSLVIKKNFGEEHEINRDIRTYSKPPFVDIISGGFPCQDISIAGKGVGIVGERSGLWTEMFRIEREVGATCLKDQSGKIFLDELSPNRGEMPEEFIPDCSLICQIEFQEILDRQVERVLKGEVSINDVR